jgi:hypothetical protein
MKTKRKQPKIKRKPLVVYPKTTLRLSELLAEGTKTVGQSKRKLTRYDLARAMEVNYNQIAKFFPEIKKRNKQGEWVIKSEKRNNANPTLSQLEKIAESLGDLLKRTVKVSELLSE